MLSDRKNNYQKQVELKTKDLVGGLTQQEPLVSIITVVFNGEKFLEETLLSVLNQSYQNIEYIIIDGGSTDKTIEIIRRYEDQLDYWISEPDAGIYDAMNKGIIAANGELIGLINCGDTYTLDAVAEVIKIFQNNVKNNKYLVISGAMYRLDPEKDIQFRIAKDLKKLEANIDKTMQINHPATFVAKSIYEKLGLFNPNYFICGDYDFIFRIYHSSLVKFIFTEKELVYMRLGGLSEQFNSLWIRCQEHFLLRKHKLSWQKNLIYCSLWYVKTVIKYALKNLVSNSFLSLYYELRHGKNTAKN